MQSRLLDGEFASRDISRKAAELYERSPDHPDLCQPDPGGRFRGWMWLGDVQPGLRGSACDIVSMTDTVIANPIDRRVWIEMLLHGEGTGLQTEGGPDSQGRIEQAQVVGLGETRHTQRVLRAGERHSKVGLIVEPAFLDRFAATLPSHDTDLLGWLMESGCRVTSLPRNDMLLGLSRTVIDDPYCGSLGAVFRESAMVQMLCQTLGLLRQERRVTREIGTRHYDAVRRARELIDADLTTPPGTLDLARRVGLNRNALQAGFKAVFGTTVFGYIRDQRLAIARALIQEHRLGAAEAGYRVGFRSASAFSAAYRMAFGRTPSGDFADTAH